MAQAIEAGFQGNTHVAILGGERVECNATTFESVCDALVKKHGGGVPNLVPLAVPGSEVVYADRDSVFVRGGEVPTGSKETVIAVRPKLVQPKPEIGVGQYDAVGDARSAVDRAAAEAAGFAPKQPVYRQGLRATGMADHKAEFEALPSADVALEMLERQVKHEARSDEEIQARTVSMTGAGNLAINAIGYDSSARIQLCERALPALATRLDLPAGAGAYLTGCWPQLRAVNVNRWVHHNEQARIAQNAEATAMSAELGESAEAAAKRQQDPKKIVLRTRRSVSGKDAREVFAAVSPGYTSYDVDQIAAALRMASPEGARAEVAYDGFRMQADVMFFSNVEPKHAVAGEFFKAGVRVSTDDTGGGSIVVQAVLWQNLCLNFIIIDCAKQEIVRLRHLGSVDKLARKFDQGFKDAIGKIESFLRTWDYAVEENVVERTARVVAATDADLAAELAKMPVSQALPGIFNGIIERELVAVPRRQRKETVGKLMTMWEADDSAATRERDKLLSRAAVVNAFTRYAHEVETDPFKGSEIEQGASILLKPNGRSGQPAPLPYLPIVL